MFKPGLVVEDDSYNRPKSNHLDFVFVNGDTEFLKLFKISKIIDKRVIYKDRIKKRLSNTSLDKQDTNLKKIVNIIKPISTELKYLLKNINGIFP